MSILCESVVSWCGAIAAMVVGPVPVMEKCLECSVLLMNWANVSCVVSVCNVYIGASALRTPISATEDIFQISFLQSQTPV